MDQRTLRALEWDRVLQLVSLCAETAEGRGRVLSLAPSPLTEEVRLRQARVEECARGESLGGRLSMEGYRRCPTQALPGTAFPLETFRSLRSSLRVWRRTLEWAHAADPPKPSLAALFPHSDPLSELSSLLERLLDSRGEVADGASQALLAIRREKERLRGAVVRKMESLVERLGGRTLQEATYTVRNGRLVLPVMASRKGEVKGILHDSSSTGATAFIEPLEMVEANNRVAELEAEEREETHRVLLDGTRKVGLSSGALEAVFDAMETLDALLACARLGSRYKGIFAAEAGGEAISIRGGCHPLLDARLAPLRREAWGEEARGDGIPLDLDLSLGGTRTLVISGPNAGGKSVALKTVGLHCLMNQAGIPLPAEEGTRLPVFPFVFASLGDSQSIMDSLSTFSARMVHLRDALDSLREPFLVLLDELGAGTDPAEGAALGEATLLHLHKRRGFSLCSTHHEPLKARALATEGMGNASMEFSEVTMSPTYRLRMGRVGASRALEIAERSGVPQALLDLARSLLPSESLRLKEVLDTLETEVEAHERAAAALKGRAAELEAARAGLDMEREHLLGERGSFADSLPALAREWEEKFVRGLKAEVNRQAVRKRAKEEAASLPGQAREAMSLPAAAPPRLSALAKGDRVSVGAFGVKGEVLSVDSGSGRVTVSCEGKSLQVGLGDVNLLEEAPEKAGTRGGYYSSPSVATTEINLIGRTAAEAEAELEPFLDRAMLAGLSEVRVIHGIGTGRLKAAVRGYLKNCPHVRAFEEAGQAFGGAGATQVSLK